MQPADDLESALDQVAAGVAAPSDLELLRMARVSGRLKVITTTDERAVTIGGDVTDAVIVTGDNTVFQGPAVEVLRQAFRAEWGEVAAERLEGALGGYLDAIHRYARRLPRLSADDFPGHEMRGTVERDFVPLLVRREDQPDASDRANGSPPEAQPISEALRSKADERTPHLLLVGEPGAGKSALLRWIALHAWTTPDAVGLSRRHLPIIVRLRFLSLAEGSAWETRLRLSLAKDPEFSLEEELPDGFFALWSKLTGAPWVVLLDGLDEIPDDRREAFLPWFLDRLQAWKDQGYLVVLTSRATEIHAISEQCRVYRVQPLTPAQEHELAGLWFGADKRGFQSALRRTWASELGKTPLLLTISAVVHRSQGQLPVQRAELYGRFVDIRVADARRRAVQSGLDERAAQLLRPTLEHLALRMTEKPKETSVNTVSRAAADFLRRELTFSRTDADTHGRRLVELAGRYTVFFVPGSFSFDWVHPTFREYLAASALARRIRVDTPAARGIMSRWNDPGWRGVLLFLLSIWARGGGDVERLLHGVVLRPGELSRGRNSFPLPPAVHFIVAAMSQGVAADGELADGIVTFLLRRAREQPKFAWGGGLGPDAPLALIGQLHSHPRVVPALLELARDEAADPEVRAASLVELLQRGDPEHLRPILAVLEPVLATDLGTLHMTARSLLVWLERAHFEKLVVDAELARRAVRIILLWARTMEVGQGLRKFPLAPLSRLGRLDNQQVTPALLEFARDTAVHAEDRAASVLVLLQRRDVDHKDAFSILSELAPVLAINTLSSIVSNLFVLGRVDVLFMLAFERSLPASVRNNVVPLLSSMAVPSMLVVLLQDESLSTANRHLVAYQLIQRGSAADLLALARDGSVPDYITFMAANALATRGQTDELEALMLNSAALAPTRLQALEALGRGEGTESTVEAVLKLCRDTASAGYIRRSGLKILEKWRRSGELVSLIVDAGIESDIRHAAAVAIGRLALPTGAAAALADIYRDRATERMLRQEVLKLLGQVGSEDQLLALAQDAALEQNDRLRAAITLFRGTQNKEILPALLGAAWDESVPLGVRVEIAEILEPRDSQGVREARDAVAAALTDAAMNPAAQFMFDSFFPFFLDALRDLGCADGLAAVARSLTASAETRLEATKALGKLGRLDAPR